MREGPSFHPRNLGKTLPHDLLTSKTKMDVSIKSPSFFSNTIQSTELSLTNDITKTLVFPSLTLLSYETNTFVGKTARHYRTRIKRIYSNKCVITLQEEGQGAVLHCHHLYSKHFYPSLEFNFGNSLPITNTLHKEYHKLVGINTANITPSTFIDFLELKLLETTNLNQLTHLNKLILWVKTLNSFLSS
jgi:hypothetical protein